MMEGNSSLDDLQQRARYATEEENRLLLSLLTERKDVIFSKRTDHMMITKKQQAWTRITELFNVAGVGPYKTCKQLKRMWEHKRSKYVIVAYSCSMIHLIDIIYCYYSHDA